MDLLGGPVIEVALCIGIEHDPWLVALAVAICSVGAFAIVQMFERARCTSGIQRFGWAFLTSVAAGATIWCTHFVAMLAFRAGVPVTLDPVLTITSLVIAIVGTFIGVGLAAWGTRDIYGAAGGAIFGLAISGMHYMGMAAYRVDGIVTWDIWLCDHVADLLGRFRKRSVRRTSPGPDRALPGRSGNSIDRDCHCNAPFRCNDRNEHRAAWAKQDTARCRRASRTRARDGSGWSNGHHRGRICRDDRSPNAVGCDARTNLHGAQRSPYRLAKPIGI